MPLGTPYIPEGVPNVVNGVVCNHTVTQLTAQFGAGNIKTPTKNFSIVYRGQHLSFVKNVPFVVDAGLLAALNAVSAPIT